MNIAALFIRRPVMTTLLMLGIVLFGIMAYRQLPVSDLPNVDFPTIQVSAILPGASPETMASAVATPLEQQFSTIAGLDSMTSSSIARVDTQITLQFNLSRNIDAAAQDVQAAIAAAGAPAAAEHAGAAVLQEGQPGRPADPLPRADLGRRCRCRRSTSTRETMMAQRISTVAGVAQVQVFGAQKYAVRVQLDPRQLASRGVGIDEVASADPAQQRQPADRHLYGPYTAFTVQANGQLIDAADYRPIDRRLSQRHAGAAGRARQRHRRRRERQDRGLVHSDKRGVILAIQKQPGTNAVEVADARQGAAARRSASSCRPSVDLRRPSSTAPSPIRDSVDDVKFTLLLTLCLVVLVIFLFLRNVSATIIPSLALPISIVGTFAVMYLLDYSLDNLSLMALTLSVGFVVDDAIVMLENIVRHMEMGEKPMEAALERLEGDRLHDHLDDHLAGRGVHPDPVHGRHPRPAVPRVRGHDRRGDSGLGLRLAHADADALQPVPAAAHTSEKHGRFYQATERFFDGMLARLRARPALVAAPPR